MPNMNVNTAAMRAYSAKMTISAFKIAACAVSVDAIKHTLPFSSDITQSVDRALELSSDNLYESRARVSRLAKAVNDAADLYEKTENQRMFLIPAILEKFPLINMISTLVLPIGGLDDGLWEGAIGGSVLAGAVSAGGAFAGITYSGTAEGSFLNYGASGETFFGYKYKADDDGEIEAIGLGAKGEAHVNLAEGSLSGDFDDLSGSVRGSLLNAAVEGSIGATLFSQGHLSPAIFAEAKASASVLEGEAELRQGDDLNNTFIKAEGTVLGAEAYAKGGVGVLQIENEDGSYSSEFGVQAEAGAEAYIAEGTISGGYEIFGIEFEVGVTGKAGGAGATAGGSITTGGISGEVGAGLGLGAGVSVSVDWSGFDPGAVLDSVVETGEAVGEFVSDAGEFLSGAGEAISDAGEAISNFFDFR